VGQKKLKKPERHLPKTRRRPWGGWGPYLRRNRNSGVRDYFFDTSALVPRYRVGDFTRKVNRILVSPNAAFYICELTVIEMSSSLAQLYRKHRLSRTEFQKMRAAFEDDIADGLLQVRTISQQDLMSARDLLEDAAVSNGRNLRSA